MLCTHTHAHTLAHTRTHTHTLGLALREVAGELPHAAVQKPNCSCS